MASDLYFWTDYLSSVSGHLESVSRRICLHLANEDPAQLSAALDEARELIGLADRLHQLITEAIGRMPAADPVPRDPPQVYSLSE